jgi:uncharacterized membrane protein YphA (DoxX/SURF4 family)
MQRLQNLFDTFDNRLTNWMALYGVLLLRISVGVVFFWFGVLKFFPDASPAEGLATQTIETLTFGIIEPSLSLPVLAVWECVIGLGLISGKFLRVIILLLFAQMVGTVTPLFIFPDETWMTFPYSPTLEGQYIIKNVVLVSAAIVIGATARGGNLVADREVADPAREKAKALVKKDRVTST